MENILLRSWSKEAFQFILHGLPNGVVILDEAGDILYANPLAAQLLAEPLESITGKQFGYHFIQNARTQLELTIDNNLKVIKMETALIEIESRKIQLVSLWNVTAEQQILEDTNKILENVKRALEESEEKFRAVFENSPESIVMIDAETATILDCNPITCKMNGYPRAEMVGQPIGKFDIKIGQGDKAEEIHHRNMERMRADGINKIETYHQRKDGTLIPVEVSASIITLNGREVVLAIDRDISERKHAEEALQLANEKLNYWVHDLEWRNQQGSLVNDVSNMLESCREVQDAYRVFGHFASRLFPGKVGHLFILSDSRNMLESAASWGWNQNNGKWLENNLVFPPDACWGVRRGQPHLISQPNDLLYCNHLKMVMENETYPYLCVPIMAQGEMLGILHLQSASGEDIKKEKRFVIEVTERFGLRLANLKMRQSLHQQSIRDPLTGLFNRRYMEETLERELRRAFRHERTLGVMMIDLDHFKHFNDTFGHHAGDVLLQELGLFLRSNVRKEDIACRYGGEEFLVILTESSLEDSIKVAEKLRKGIRHLQIQYQQESLGRVTASMGVASFPEHGSSMRSIVDAADSALLKAKKEGRDKVVVAGNSVSGRGKVH